MWLWGAFNMLSTTRPRGFSLGRISYREVLSYAQDLGLGESASEFLWDVIQKVDSKFLSLLADAKDKPTPPKP